MKTLTTLTAAAALAIAFSAPVLAKDSMTHVRDTAGTQAQAYVPPAQSIQDPAAYAGQY